MKATPLSTNSSGRGRFSPWFPSSTSRIPSRWSSDTLDLGQTIAEFLNVSGDFSVQLRGFCCLVTESRSKSFHLLFERFTVVFDLLGTYIPSGREHVTVFADVF